MNTTIEDQEAVIDRLSWCDDDVVFSMDRIFVKRYRMARAPAPTIQALIDGTYLQFVNVPGKVLLPFMSLDGVLFKPEQNDE